MKAVGLKSLSWLVIFMTMAITLYFMGIVDRELIVNTDFRLAFAIGLLVTSLSGIVFRAFDLHEVSGSALIYCSPLHPAVGSVLVEYKHHKICLSHNIPIEAYELSSISKRLLVFASLMMMGTATFQFKQLNILLNSGNHHFLGRDHVCKFNEKKEKAEQDIRPECRLIMRAFELGYAKDLGNCGKKADEKPVFCDLQHEDEPDLHYSYRLFDRFYSSVRNNIGNKDLKLVEEDLKRDAANYQPMMNILLSDINHDPKSAHIIVTSLPNPKGSIAQLFEPLLKKSHCVRWYQKLPNAPVKSQEQMSSYLDHSLGHLLFDTSYANTVAHCDEFEILWGQNEKVCQDLTSHPEATLRQIGMEKNIDRVLKYYDEKSKVRQNLKYRQPSEFLSVNCFSYGGQFSEITTKDITFKGVTIPFRWMKLGTVSEGVMPSISFFKSAAMLMAPNFRYGNFQSQASVVVDPSQQVGEELFAADNYHLSRLGFLRDADVFLGSPWIESRADILEVYPYYLHLEHFVEMFRNSYHKNRGQIQ
jgi:hypothetical protein